MGAGLFERFLGVCGWVAFEHQPSGRFRSSCERRLTLYRDWPGQHLGAIPQGILDRTRGLKREACAEFNYPGFAFKVIFYFGPY